MLAVPGWIGAPRTLTYHARSVTVLVFLAGAAEQFANAQLCLV